MTNFKQINTQVIGGFAHELRNMLFAVRTVVDAVLANEGSGGIEGKSLPAQNVEGLQSLMAQLEATLAPNDFAKAQAISQAMHENERVTEDAFIQVMRTTERCTKMLNELVSFSRIGLSSRGNNDIDMVTVVTTVIEDSKAEINAAQIRVSTELGVDTRVIGVSWHFETLVKNLITNCITALSKMPAGAPRNIDVLFHKSEGMCTLTVRDTGPGIPAHVRIRLFEPFFTTQQGSTGLGLTVAHQLAALHGGDIRVDSEPGEGTEVVVRFTTR